MKTFTIWTGTPEKETPKAYGVAMNADERITWFPKSLTELEDIDGAVVLHMPAWFAYQKLGAGNVSQLLHVHNGWFSYR